MEEIRKQPRALDAFSSERFRQARAGSVFVGAGDSFAAALIVSYITSGKFLARDPYVLLTSRDLVKGKDVFFLSVSGRTKSNVAAARSVRGIARRIAVTSNSSSPLAEECDEVVSFPYAAQPRVVGTLSFTLSLLTLLKLAFGRVECDFQGAYRKGRRLSKEFSFSRRGTTYFLGNQAGHGVAVYAAAKVYEILGAKSHAELLEEFSHMELFSLTHGDVVNILGPFDPVRAGTRLLKALRSRKYYATLVGSRDSAITQIFSLVFAIQLGVLGHAKMKGLSEPFLNHAAEKLDVSDSMIY